MKYALRKPRIRLRAENLKDIACALQLISCRLPAERRSAAKYHVGGEERAILFLSVKLISRVTTDSRLSCAATAYSIVWHKIRFC